MNENYKTEKQIAEHLGFTCVRVNQIIRKTGLNPVGTKQSLGIDDKKIQYSTKYYDLIEFRKAYAKQAILSTNRNDFEFKPRNVPKTMEPITPFLKITHGARLNEHS